MRYTALHAEEKETKASSRAHGWWAATWKGTKDRLRLTLPRVYCSGYTGSPRSLRWILVHEQDSVEDVAMTAGESGDKVSNILPALQ
jgi:hypothetical protein